MNEIEIAYEDEIEEYAEKAKSLYESIEGTVPGDRNFGLSPDFIDMPINLAKNAITMSIIEKTELYIPQVNVDEVSFEQTDTGLKVAVELSENEDYEEDEDE